MGTKAYYPSANRSGVIEVDLDNDCKFDVLPEVVKSTKYSDDGAWKCISNYLKSSLYPTYELAREEYIKRQLHEIDDAIKALKEIGVLYNELAMSQPSIEPNRHKRI